MREIICTVDRRDEWYERAAIYLCNKAKVGCSVWNDGALKVHWNVMGLSTNTTCREFVQKVWAKLR